MKILFLSAELAPLAKEGGLGDVAGALPKALADLGVDITIFLPFYGSIDVKKYPAKKICRIKIPINIGRKTATVWQTKLPKINIPVYLIKHNYFKSKLIYTDERIFKKNKYTRGMEDIKRFAFFDSACLEAARALKFKPDVIHANDWHTALITTLLKQKENGFFSQTKVLYTIHNLANQGIAEPEIVGFSKLDSDLPIVKADLKNGDINFMVQGILNGDLISTVSKNYAKEITASFYGAGLDKIIKKRRKDLYGILNGIDTDFFNPETDKYIKQKYSIKSLDKKAENKLALQKRLGLPQNKNIALIGIVSRLVWQKGFELITEEFGKLDCQFAILGTGQPQYEKHFKELAKKYPDKFSAQITFDAELAQQIYAGADIFLMPSRFEPCGLGQMIAMRYGAIPIVRATGGLADTVNNKVGFCFKEFSRAALRRTVKKALNVYYNQPQKWRELQKNGMKKDFSWNKSAKEYLKLYKKLCR